MIIILEQPLAIAVAVYGGAQIHSIPGETCLYFSEREMTLTMRALGPCKTSLEFEWDFIDF